MFAPSAQDAATVKGFFTSKGLVVVEVGPKDMYVRALGTVANVNNAFQIQLNDFQFNGRTVYANTSEPVVTGAAGVLTGAIYGLHNLQYTHPNVTQSVNARKTMSLQDAKKILTGGDDSVTQFFRAKTEGALTVKFLPIVKQATDRVGLARKYDQVAEQGAKLGLVKGDAANIDEYVTHKALDGLYLIIGEEECAIRKNPAAAATAIVSEGFGAVH